MPTIKRFTVPWNGVVNWLTRFAISSNALAHVCVCRLSATPLLTARPIRSTATRALFPMLPAKPIKTHCHTEPDSPPGQHYPNTPIMQRQYQVCWFMDSMSSSLSLVWLGRWACMCCESGRVFFLCVCPPPRDTAKHDIIMRSFAPYECRRMENYARNSRAFALTPTLVRVLLCRTMESVCAP